MTALTVVVAPPGVADGVYGVLTDLSAAGLLDSFAWVSSDSPAPPLTSVVMVTGGRTADVGLADLVATRMTSVLRVCVLVPAFGGHARLAVPDETRLTEQLARTTGAGRVVRIRCLLTSSGGVEGGPRELAVDGWHNIVVSPEDGRGPHTGRVPLPDGLGVGDVGRHVGPVVASLTGLWRGVDHAPLDDAAVPPGQVVRLARSYYRRLDTDEVEIALRRAVLAQSGTLPLPSDPRSQVVYVNDVGMATASMADALWRRYGDVLQGKRAVSETPSVRHIGAWEGLTMFLGFLWAALKNAPGAWYRSIVEGVSTRIARGVQQTMFDGVPAAYEVVVRGRTASGEYAGWAAIGAASGQLSGVLAGQNENVHESDADLSMLWRDYARAALTLADAGSRESSLPPIQVGSARAVVADANQIVPGPAERFTAIPGVIAAALHSDGVDATNPLGVRDLGNRLVDLERDPDHGVQARSTLTALDAWRRRGSRSFAAAVGGRLAGAFDDRYAEVRQLIERLRDAPEPPADPEGIDMRLARWVQVVIAMLFVLAGVFTFLAYAGHVAWWVALLGIVVAVLVSLGLCTVAFVRAQRRVFALLHQRQALLGESEVNEQNLRTALRELKRLAQAYGQFLSWSRALGSFLAAPLGPDGRGQAPPLPVSWGLPMSTGLATAQPAAADVDVVADYLRRELFNRGWLGGLWNDLVSTSLPARSATAEQRPEDAPVWAERGMGTGSGLDRWSTDVFRGAVTSTGADLVWQKAVWTLHGPLVELVPRLVGSVQVVGGPRVSLDEFFVGLDRDAPAAGGFDHALLSDLALTTGAASVASDVRDRARIGLGQVCVSTQFGETLSVDDLRRPPGDAGPPATHVRPDPNPRPDPFQVPEIGKGFGF